jgi:phosphonate transport system substrate-binding protein
MSRRLVLALVGAVLVAACGGGGGGGTAATPEPAKSDLTMALVPSSQAQQVLTSAQPIADYLSKEIGTPVKAQVPTSYAAVVEGMTSNLIDIAWVGALAYVAANQKSGAEAVTKSARCAPTYSAAAPAPDCVPKPTYPSIIICSTAAGVPDLKDGGDWSALKGKRFVFGDSISTSSNLWPRYYMKHNKVDPDKDFSKVSSISSQGAIALAVNNGTADCGAMFGDARTTVARTAPDIFTKTKVVFIAPEEIPGDPQMVRKNLNPGQKDKVKAALRKLGKDPAMKKQIDALYQIASMEPATDADYNPVRKVVRDVNPNVLGEAIAPPSPSAGASAAPSASPTR